MSANLELIRMVAHRPAVRGRASIDVLSAGARARFLMPVLASVLLIGAPIGASGQSISPERAVLNRTSAATLRGPIGERPDRSTVADGSHSTSGARALLGSHGSRNLSNVGTSMLLRGLGVQDSYRVWVAEVMLTQTGVATVIPYYRRFLERFPDLETFAAAPLDDVVKAWDGLTDYVRIRARIDGEGALLGRTNPAEVGIRSFGGS